MSRLQTLVSRAQQEKSARRAAEERVRRLEREVARLRTALERIEEHEVEGFAAFTARKALGDAR